MRKGSRGRYEGLTFWSPNINIFRDPRWGRGQETYGEDPFLTGRLAVQFVSGMQADDPRYVKTISTLKHFAVHSGPEPTRHRFDARPSERDLHESYLPHFAAGIEQGGARSVMCAYNRIDGAPACASDLLLGQNLRGAWGFRGYVVSDCGAIDDIYERHKVVATAAEASAMAVKAGTDLECGDSYKSLVDAVRRGLVAESVIDTAVVRLFTARFALGMFDPPSMVKWARIPYSELDSPAHRALARRASRESMVLLKNARHTLPLRKDLRSIAVIGPDADDAEVLLGNYNGTPADPVTVLRGIREAVGGGASKVTYARGSDLAAELAPGVDSTHPATSAPARARADSLLAEAVKAARGADAVVLVLGLSPRIEGEEMPVHIPGFAGGDRSSLDLPPAQERLLERVVTLGRPTVVVLMNGGALSATWAAAHVPAIVEAWYPGQAGGSAVADVLFGDANPGGRLPVTFYRSVSDLPSFDDYAMAGHTYRFFRGRALYPFGFGLSYTTFSYASLRTSANVLGGNDTITVSVDVKNTGTRAGDEVVQLYARHVGSKVARPIRDLRGYARVSLTPGAPRTVTMRVPARSLAYWDPTRHGWRLESDRVRLEVGAWSGDVRAATTVTVRGDP